MDTLSSEAVIVGREYPEVVTPLLFAAKRSVKIVVFDWRVYLESGLPQLCNFNDAVFKAAARGLDVRAVVNSVTVLNVLKQNKVNARHYVHDAILHAKMVIIDDSTCVLGSHNFSNNAFGSNMEVSVVFKIDGAEHRVAKFFERIWGL